MYVLITGLAEFEDSLASAVLEDIIGASSRNGAIGAARESAKGQGKTSTT
jgi:hypothetical protein